MTRAGGQMLMLTTTAPEGPVAEQSLTVRASDFHPVSRRIAFRDSATIEIAEVEFKILPWSAVDASVFEPLPTVDMAGTASSARILPFRMLTTISAGQLDEAELSVRLVLNQLHADMGEQIQINRGPQGIEVTGLVDNDERKRQLQMPLRAVPHVTASIQSLADLKDSPAVSNGMVAVTTASMAPLPSPLGILAFEAGPQCR